ncbi:hypothetical protein MRB53_037106 [Persea americana]|nr:hypothetical protein MRB53_037106 [Persea americana]
MQHWVELTLVGFTVGFAVIFLLYNCLQPHRVGTVAVEPETSVAAEADVLAASARGAGVRQARGSGRGMRCNDDHDWRWCLAQALGDVRHAKCPSCRVQSTCFFPMSGARTIAPPHGNSDPESLSHRCVANGVAFPSHHNNRAPPRRERRVQWPSSRVLLASSATNHSSSHAAVLLSPTITSTSTSNAPSSHRPPRHEHRRRRSQPLPTFHPHFDSPAQFDSPPQFDFQPPSASFFPDEPRAPTVRTRIPGPKSRAAIAELDEHSRPPTATPSSTSTLKSPPYPWDTTTPALLSAASSPAMVSALVNRPALGNFPSHDWSSLLTSSLLRVAPKGLDQVFTATAGSDANETAYKAAFMWKAQQRRGGRDVDFTAEEMASSMRNEAPGAPNMSILSFSRRSRRCAIPLEQYEAENAAEEARCLAEVERLIVEYPSPPAAVVVEPIQSEGGDNHASPAFFRGLREITTKHDVPPHRRRGADGHRRDRSVLGARALGPARAAGHCDVLEEGAGRGVLLRAARPAAQQAVPAVQHVDGRSGAGAAVPGDRCRDRAAGLGRERAGNGRVPLRGVDGVGGTVPG